MKPSSPLKTALLLTTILSIVIPMPACDMLENNMKFDRGANLETQDYRDALAPREAAPDKADNNIPELQPYVADNSQSMKAMPLVSVAINQSIPLRDALFELAKQADVDIQLDPRIRGSIIYTARNKPFDVVLRQISDIAGLRYSIADDTLKIQLDTPYTKIYKIDYLSFTRENKSSIETSTKVDGGGGGGGSGGGSTSGSTFGISSESKTDFWGELDSNIKQILEANSQLNYLKTAADPEITVENSALNPPVPPISEGELQGNPPTPPSETEPQAGYERHSALTTSNVSAAQLMNNNVAARGGAAPVAAPINTSQPQAPGDIPTGSAVAPTTSPPDDQSAAQQANTVPLGTNATTVAPQQVQLNVNSLPTTGGASEDGVTYTPTYSINKQAGLLSINATQKAHDQIETYLGLLRQSIASQVLIEAKVLEVELNDEFATGVDWSVFTDNGSGINNLVNGLSLGQPAFSPQDPGTNSFSVVASGDLGKFNIDFLVQAMQRFGTVHGLASPRLTVLNNQAAVLNVAENRVYFEIDAQREEATDGGDDTITVDSEARTVPEGVLINVLPSVDLDKGTISMQVRPTITRITSLVTDPAVPIVLAQSGADPSLVVSQVPEVSVKEIDTVVNMHSGQAIVMGGLLEDRTDSTRRQVPLAGELPFVGPLFRNRGDAVRKTELVIFIKATILSDEASTVHNTDKDLYRLFSGDRRPFKL